MGIRSIEGVMPFLLSLIDVAPLVEEMDRFIGEQKAVDFPYPLPPRLPLVESAADRRNGKPVKPCQQENHVILRHPAIPQDTNNVPQLVGQIGLVLLSHVTSPYFLFLFGKYRRCFLPGLAFK